MKNLKKLTILHSNDLHGDFMAKEVNQELLGGVSMLSGYVDKVRREEKNVIYAIAGDMFRGSIIDSEYKGISTIEIMNMIAPDIVTLGNHEVDYGVAHLLFIERCAQFPIINANMYLTTNHVRLFNSHVVLEVDGMKILFIGVLTEEVLAQARQEKLVGSIVDVYEAASEIGKICNAYQTEDIDFTVLLTHIGFEEDKKLAVDYLNLEGKNFMDCRWEFIRSALGSVARIAIIPIQDYIGLGTEARINVPSTLGNNWKWRMKNKDLPEELLEEIKRINQIYKRGN